MTIQIIGWIATALTSISFLPQLFKIIKTRETKDVSLWMIILIILASTIWIIFGLWTNNPQLWATNLIQITVLFIIFIYKISNFINYQKLKKENEEFLDD